jgi:DNA-binding NtrC family response regulator
MFGINRKQVLIIEDEAYLQIYWEEVCDEVGLTVAGFASTVPEAIKLVENSRFAGVVLDVTLTDGTTEEVAEHLRHSLTPVIVCTGDPHKLPEAFHGFTVLEKPLSFSQMEEALKKEFKV